jgi:hypothetical protein
MSFVENDRMAERAEAVVGRATLTGRDSLTICSRVRFCPRAISGLVDTSFTPSTGKEDAGHPPAYYLQPWTRVTISK